MSAADLVIDRMNGPTASGSGPFCTVNINSKREINSKDSSVNLDLSNFGRLGCTSSFFICCSQLSGPGSIEVPIVLQIFASTLVTTSEFCRTSNVWALKPKTEACHLRGRTSLSEILTAPIECNAASMAFKSVMKSLTYLYLPSSKHWFIAVSACRKVSFGFRRIKLSGSLDLNLIISFKVRKLPSDKGIILLEMLSWDAISVKLSE